MPQKSLSTESPGLNYFVCTLGQAAEINAHNSHGFETVNDFVDCQARAIPQSPAVGFPFPSSLTDDGAEWQHRIFTFEDLRQGSIAIGQTLSKSLHAHTSSGETVALLCPSSVDFLFAWLGLMRLGCSVLLIAPQCQPAAIAHLCKSCHISNLFYEESYEALAGQSTEASSSWPPLHRVRLPSAKQRDELLEHITLTGDFRLTHTPSLELLENDVAYLHHTSGTSTGLPKPIPQSHRAAVGVLPCLDNGQDKATFTTTPLYHGGISDCFRAWTSNALIWLFPGKGVPITAQNVLKSLECAERSVKHDEAPSVAYFSSVPYVLQLVAADEKGLQMLKSMEVVGVGGAALPQEVGDDLVEKGVNLISRFGSAECGFLMSSHRNYTTDKEWQYLRNNGSKTLVFEPQDDGLAELIVLPQWPHMAKRNRDDGSFASADLFAAHSMIPNAWKYHSRADSQLTLITGKKFDPAPLETAIAISPLLSDVLIFGNGHQYPGALLFRSSNSVEMSGQQLVDNIWPSIEKLNAETQGHARLSRPMLVVMSKDAPGLRKSSKGTTMRNLAESKYQTEIEKVYQCVLGVDSPDHPILDDDLPIEILRIIKSVTGTQGPIPEDADLFSFGVDSVACMQIRMFLQSKMLSPSMPQLPLNVVYDCGTIKSLSKYLLNIRRGRQTPREDETQLMLDLVQEHGSFPSLPAIPTTSLRDSSRSTIILTGATGSLGTHVLSILLSHPSHPHITALVRAATTTAAYHRVSKSLSSRHLPSPTEKSNLRCLPVKFSENDLGLSAGDYSTIATNATSIIHAAWAVNFRASLRSFTKDHILGLRNLLLLALSSPHIEPPKFIFCSSTASVISTSPPFLPIEETISPSPLTASPLGYSRSKWVAEGICARAYASTRLKGRVSVLRVGQLCGDRERGVWNASEAWPLMLSSVKVNGCLPDLVDEALGWLPVDVAAAAVVEAADIYGFPEDRARNDGEVPVYHILNPYSTPEWSDLLRWLHRLYPKFETVPPRAWVERLEILTGEAAKHPARKLLGLWRDVYCGNNMESKSKETKLTFETEKTKSAIPVMKDVRPIDEEMFGKLWHWIDGEMLIAESSAS